jgi:hypothetical protein
MEQNRPFFKFYWPSGRRLLPVSVAVSQHFVNFTLKITGIHLYVSRGRYFETRTNQGQTKTAYTIKLKAGAVDPDSGALTI